MTPAEQERSSRRRRARRARRALLARSLALRWLCLAAAAVAAPGRPRPRLVYAPGRSSRSRPRSRTKKATWSTAASSPTCAGSPQHFPIYVTDGYSGPLPSGEHVGCNRCHVAHSDHYNGLAVDIVPLSGEREMRRQLGADHPPRPLGRAGPEPARARPSAGSATTATPATAAATTCTSPGTTRRRPSTSSPNGSKSSRSAHAPASRAAPPPPRSRRTSRRRGRRIAAGPTGGVSPADRRHDGGPRPSTGQPAALGCERPTAHRTAPP